MRRRFYQKAISIVEILVAVAIISLGLVTILGLANFTIKASTAAKEATLAKNIAEETLEITRNFRDNVKWNNDDPQNQYDGLGVIKTNTAYHPEQSTDSPPRWMLLEGEDTSAGFGRKIIFENVSRNPTTGDIDQTYNPTNHDPNTKKIIVTIFWKEKSLQITTLLTNWQ